MKVPGGPAAGGACLWRLLTVLLIGAGTVSSSPAPLFRSIGGERFLRSGQVSTEELRALRGEAETMFNRTYQSYMSKAFPLDEIRPLTCRGENTFGGIALTLVDSLDTLLVMGMRAEFEYAVRWISDNLTYDRDQRVSVFEVTIRAVGSLVSAHSLAILNPELVPGYTGDLLRLAVDLGRRLLPAFETESGVPLAWVNLRKGNIPGDTRNTCTAGAGTLHSRARGRHNRIPDTLEPAHPPELAKKILLEFGMLSRLSGERVFWDKARAAMVTLYRQRSKMDLLGNTINADSLAWLRQESGIGAGIDSYYEYLLKGYLMFGDREMLSMFATTYAAAMTHMRQGSSRWSWLVDVRMDTGKLAKPWVSSLGAFWPGMQALVGQVEDAARLHSDLFVAWKNFGGLPELFDLTASKRHPTERGYPLRPELIESTFVLHSATKAAYLLEVGRELQATIMDHHSAPCGFASCKDVQTRSLEDSVETFFFAETAKYLYLLHSNTSSLLHHYMLTTEGHLLPPLPDDFWADGKVDLRRLLRGGGGGNPGGRHVDATSSSEGKSSGASSASSAEGDAAGSQDSGPCEDMSQYCGYWAGIKECEKNPRYMRAHCRRSCGLCPEARPVEVAGGGDEGGEVELDEDVHGEVARSSCRAQCEEGAAPPWEAEEASDAALRGSFPLLPPLPGAPALLARRRCIACINVARALTAAQDKRARSLLVSTHRQRHHQDHPAKKVVCQTSECSGGRCVCKDGGTELPLDAAPRIPESTRERVEAALARSSVPPSNSRLLFQQQQQRAAATSARASSDGGGVSVGSAAQFQAGLDAARDGGGACGADGPREAVTGGRVGSQRGRPLMRMLCSYRVVGTKIYCDGLEEVALKTGPESEAQLEVLGESMLVIQVSEEVEDRARGVLRLEGAGSAAVKEALGLLGYHVECPPGPAGGGPTACLPRAAVAAGDTFRGLVLAAGWSEVEAMPSTFGEQGWPGAAEDAEALPLVYAAPADACAPLSNAVQVKGAIVVVERGGCTFISKAVIAELAGAAAIVVVNSVGDGAGGLVLMGEDGSGVSPQLPAVLVRRAEGSLLRRLMREGEIPGGSLMARLFVPVEPREMEATDAPLPPPGPELQQLFLQGRVELLFSKAAHQRLLSMDLGSSIEVGGLVRTVHQFIASRYEPGSGESQDAAAGDGGDRSPPGGRDFGDVDCGDRSPPGGRDFGDVDGGMCEKEGSSDP